MSSGEANIWNPRTLLQLSSDTKRIEEKLTAIAGQTLFTLKDFTYVVNTGSLAIYLLTAVDAALGVKGGRLLKERVDWAEGTVKTFSLTIALVAGDQITAVGYVAITALVDVRDTDIFISNYQAIRDYTGTEITLYAQGKVTHADGGEHFFNKVTGAAPGTHVDNNDNVIVPTGGDGSIGWIRRVIEDEKLLPTTLSVMLNDARFSPTDVGKSVPMTGERLIGKDGGGFHDIVLTGTTVDVDLPNTTDIVVGIADSSISFVLRKPAIIIADQYGQDDVGVKRFLEIVGTDRIGVMGAKTYTATSEIAQSFTFCRIMGVPGKTKITGAFGFSVMQLLASNDAVFEDIIFETTFVSGSDDLATAIVHSQKVVTSRITFNRCKLTGIASGCNGIGFYPRTLVGDTVGSSTDLTITSCDFEDIGRIGCVLLNRGTAADKYGAFKGLNFSNNRCKKLGIISTFGFLITLDGFGSEFHVDKNRLEDCLDIGIENTGWIDGSIDGNTFSDFSRVWAPIQTSGNIMTGLSISNNKTREPASQLTFFSNIDDSSFNGNFFETLTGNGVSYRDCNRNEIVGDHYKAGTGSVIAAFIESVARNCQDNIFTNVHFDTSSGTNIAAVRFDGVNTKHNCITAPILNLGTGGSFVDEISSAAANRVEQPTSAGGGKILQDQTSNFTSDADKTLNISNSIADTIRLTDSGVVLTAARNVILPDIEKTYTIYNETAQTLTIKHSTGAGVAIATLKTAIVNAVITSITRATADV